jgi:hypothetical protein
VAALEDAVRSWRYCREVGREAVQPLREGGRVPPANSDAASAAVANVVFGCLLASEGAER